MKKGFLHLTVLFIFISLLLSGCESKKLKQENEELKKQVESLAGGKAAAETKANDLTAQVSELTKKNEELKTKVAELTNTNKKPKSKTSKKQPPKKNSKKKKK